MTLTSTEQTMLIWVVTTLLGIIAFVGVLGVKALIKMGNDLSEIKTIVMVQSTKHDSLERRVELLEENK